MNKSYLSKLAFKTFENLVLIYFKTYLNLLLRLVRCYLKSNLQLVGIYSIAIQLLQPKSNVRMVLKVKMIDQLLKRQKNSSCQSSQTPPSQLFKEKISKVNFKNNFLQKKLMSSEN